MSNEVIYRAASHLNVRINEILRGRTLENLPTEERAKVGELQELTEDLAGLQVDLGAMRAEIARLSDWKESAMDVFSKWDAVGEALIDKPKLGASTAGQALEEAAKFRKRIAELEKALKPFADIATAVDGFSIGDLYPLKCEDVNYHHSFGFARIVECRAARAALAAAEPEIERDLVAAYDELYGSNLTAGSSPDVAAERKGEGNASASEESNDPHCPECGYTKHDSAMWLDHDRCKGKIPTDGAQKEGEK